MIDRPNAYGGGIQMTGMMSGFDTQEIVESLLKRETDRLENTIKEVDKLQFQQEAWAEIREKFMSLEATLYDMRSGRALTSTSATSSNENIISANANNNSITENFYVNVDQLASSTKVTGNEPIQEAAASNIALSNLGNFFPGEFTFVLHDDQGEEYNLQIQLDQEDTIQDVIDKINTEIDENNLDNLVDYAKFENGRFILEGTEELFDIQLGADGDSSNLSSILQLEGAQLDIDGNVLLKSSNDLSKYANISDGNLTINGVNITASEDTLDSFLTKINQSDANVFAYIENDNIVIQNRETGPRNLTITGSEDLMKELGLRDDLGDTSFNREAGKESIIRVSPNSDGTGSTQLTSWDNSFSHNNVDLNINQTSDTWVEINVEKDTEATFNQIKDFVEEYNDLMMHLHERYTEEDVTGVDPDEMSEEDKMQGVLRGDRRLRSIIEGVRRIVYGSSQGDTGEFSSLAQIGIRSGDVGRNFENTQRGLLMIDEDRLKTVLEENTEDVFALLSRNETDDKGILTQLRTHTRGLSRFQGTIHNIHRPQGILDRQINENTRRIESLYRTLEQRETTFYRQFQAMERALMEMQSQQQYLMNAFQ